MTKIKICGLKREEDIYYVNSCRPDYAGFVFTDRSRRFVTPVIACRLRERLAPAIIPVGVFVNERPEKIAELLKFEIISMVQLHGQETEEYIKRLKGMTNKPVIKAFSIQRKEDMEKALESAADYILLDNGAGGTGKTFDWSLSKEADRPFFLAGGLSPENVRQAVKKLYPFAVDVSSGVETEGKKDLNKITAFINAVRKG